MAREPSLPERPRRHDERGAALVEFAFAFPVLLLAVAAGLTFLWAAFVHVSAGHAAREGARYASVALPPTYREHPRADMVITRVRNRVPVLRLADGDVAVTYPGCADPCTAPPANGFVVVTVSKDLPSPIAAFARMLGSSGVIEASSRGEVRAE